MAFAHDSVRVLQCFIQFGSHEQRREAFEELKGEQTSAAFLTVLYCTCLSVCDSHVHIIRQLKMEPAIIVLVS